MATYFMFGKYSAEAVKGISAMRTEEAGKLIEKNGGSVKSVYALLGDMDLVVIATFPGLKQAIKSSVALTGLTGIAFTTCEAIEAGEFDSMF